MTLPASADYTAKQQRFMALLTPCLARLSRYCHSLTGDTEEGRDLLSDAILLAFEHFDEMRAEQAFTSYIFITARRLYYRRSRRNRIWSPFSKETHHIVGHDATVAEMRFDTSMLDAALSRLPEKQREAVILFEITGLSLAEIQEIQGGSLSGVKSRIVRGRERLAKLLRDRENAYQLRECV